VSLRFSALAAWYIHILSPPLPPIEALFLSTPFFINVAPKPYEFSQRSTLSSLFLYWRVKSHISLPIFSFIRSTFFSFLLSEFSSSFITAFSSSSSSSEEEEETEAPLFKIIFFCFCSFFAVIFDSLSLSL
jgi:hypothetical protein